MYYIQGCKGVGLDLFGDLEIYPMDLPCIFQNQTQLLISLTRQLSMCELRSVSICLNNITRPFLYFSSSLLEWYPAPQWTAMKKGCMSCSTSAIQIEIELFFGHLQFSLSCTALIGDDRRLFFTSSDQEAINECKSWVTSPYRQQYD